MVEIIQDSLPGREDLEKVRGHSVNFFFNIENTYWLFQFQKYTC